MSLQSHELHHDYNHAGLQLEQLNRGLANTGGHKILVIDDDADLCLGLHIRLKANSYNTCFARDAESAISVAITEMPDLIILDLGLPGDDGYAVMQRFSAFPELAAIPIIVLTARDRFTHEKRARNAGAKRFLEKPIDDRRLLMGIRQLLGD